MFFLSFTDSVFLGNRFRLANHGSKIHKILKITNKIRNVLNIRDVFKGKKTLQNRLWSHTPKPILFFLRGISMGTMSSGVIRRRSL